MIAPEIFWPSLLGSVCLVAGIVNYRRDLVTPAAALQLREMALAPVFIAAPLAAFSGEHFTLTNSISRLVPKWMPAHLFITYFVGVALLAAALSLVARRYLRWSTFLLGVMFALFALLQDLPATLAHPTVHLYWALTARQTTFSMGAFALFSIELRERRGNIYDSFAEVARAWTGTVLVFYGIYHFLYPKFTPGVPGVKPTSSWVPFPLALAYLTGTLLIIFGIGMFVRRYAWRAGAAAGSLMVLLTLGLYVPEFFRAHGSSQWLTAINYVGDTLLFGGTLLVISKAILFSESTSAASANGLNGKHAFIPRMAGDGGIV